MTRESNRDSETEREAQRGMCFTGKLEILILQRS